MGGHCIAVDPWFVVSKTPDSARLIRTAREVNDGKPEWVIDKVQETVREWEINAEGDKNSVKIICLGVAIKADIDDLRESPALDITVQLANRYQGLVSVVEPNIKNFLMY